MKNNSIEHFYERINKHIMLLAAYLEDSSYSFIIPACRLKPYSAVFEKFNLKTQLHWWWVDDNGNSLKVIGKDTKIIINDLLLDKSKLICTDMFAGLSLKDVSSNSRLAFILSGKEEDTDTDYYIVSFLGNDNFLRTFIYIYGVWAKYPALMLGKKTLTTIYKYLNTREGIKLDNDSVETVFPCSKFSAWITNWPAQQSFISNIGNDFLINNIKENN